MLNVTSRPPRSAGLPKLGCLTFAQHAQPRVLRFMVFDLQACQGCVGPRMLLVALHAWPHVEICQERLAKCVRIAA